MSDCSLMARWFLIGGAALAVIGLALWWLLPVPLGSPPYLATAMLALTYGAVCLRRKRTGRIRQP